MTGADPPVFGERPRGVECRGRLAAYAVILRDDGSVAVVRGKNGCFLPGGGARPGESPEATLSREVAEELGCGVRVLAPIGEAVQYFHSADDQCWYEMRASFFLAELTSEVVPSPEPEVKVEWIRLTDQPTPFFHASHAWAVSATRL